MERKRFFYTLRLQYLGYRFHGWQRQPGVKTVQKTIERVISYLLDRRRFKLIPTGRTDARVSVSETFVEIIVEGEPLKKDFLSTLNFNLPDDIRALGMEETNSKFNIIQDSKQKEYSYYFAVGEKLHPFCAPFMTGFVTDLDLDSMKKAAPLFEGRHDFQSYVFRPSPETNTLTSVEYCQIERNTTYQANFFPDKSYVLRVRGGGFKRHQIRLMMGALFDLGLGRIDIPLIKQSLNPKFHIKMTRIAKASGLILEKVDFG